MLPVPLPEPRGTRLYMDVVHMACAVRKAGNGVEQCGTYDVADLKASMIVTVSKGRQFSDLLIEQGCRAELLRKNGVGDVDILDLVSTVSDAHAAVIGLRQVIIEIRADSLYRGRVYRRGCEG